MKQVNILMEWKQYSTIVTTLTVWFLMMLDIK